MRAMDIDRCGKVWIYRPEVHKTLHHGYSREIRIGPKAQNILEPFLTKLDLSAFIFSPTDAEASRREILHRQRRTPMSWGNRPGSNRRRKPKQTPGERYSVSAYRRAVERGCDLAYPPPSELARIHVIGAKGRAGKRTRNGDADLAQKNGRRLWDGEASIVGTRISYDTTRPLAYGVNMV